MFDCKVGSLPAKVVAKAPFRTRFILKYRIPSSTFHVLPSVLTFQKVRMAHMALSPRWHPKNSLKKCG